MTGTGVWLRSPYERNGCSEYHGEITVVQRGAMGIKFNGGPGTAVKQLENSGYKIKYDAFPDFSSSDVREAWNRSEGTTVQERLKNVQNILAVG